MNRNLSYVAMSTEEVIRRAQAMIDVIDTDREAARKALLAAEREAARKSWFRRLFRLEMPSDEKLIDGLRSYAFNEYDSTYIMFGLQRDTAERLIRAAQNAQDGIVYITAEDMRALA